jgi:hypothetical protein
MTAPSFNSAKNGSSSDAMLNNWLYNFGLFKALPTLKLSLQTLRLKLFQETNYLQLEEAQATLKASTKSPYAVTSASHTLITCWMLAS